jgi:hypothetical protein
MSQIRRPAAPHTMLVLATLVAVIAALTGAAALAMGKSAASASGPGKVETLRFFSKDVAIRLTTADGTVFRKPPFPQPQPGDVLEVNSLDYVGNHRRHARHWSASQHLRCVFSTGEPDCEAQVAIRGSLLIFGGNPGTLINGTGRYQGATGRVIRNKEVRGGNDVVARIRLAR